MKPKLPTKILARSCEEVAILSGKQPEGQPGDSYSSWLHDLHSEDICAGSGGEPEAVRGEPEAVGGEPEADGRVSRCSGSVEAAEGEENWDVEEGGWSEASEARKSEGLPGSRKAVSFKIERPGKGGRTLAVKNTSGGTAPKVRTAFPHITAREGLAAGIDIKACLACLKAVSSGVQFYFLCLQLSRAGTAATGRGRVGIAQNQGCGHRYGHQ